MNSDKLRNNIPIFGVAFIYLSYSHLYHYYSAFGIDIFNYLDAEEIVLSIIPILLNLAPFAVIVAMFFLDYSIESSKENSDQVKKKKPYYLESLLMIICISLVVRGLVSIPFDSGYELAKNVEFFKTLNAWTNWSLIIFGIIFPLSALIITNILMRFYPNHKDFLLGLLFFFFCIIYGFGRSISGHIEYEHPSYGTIVKFKYKGVDFESGKNFMLLIETKNYILGYKPCRKKTDRLVLIFPKHDIESLSIYTKIKERETIQTRPNERPR